MNDATREKDGDLKRALRIQTVGYILTALGLVAGIAWNEAIKSFIEYVLPLGQNTLLAKFFYALVVTAAIVMISVYLARFAGGRKETS